MPKISVIVPIYKVEAYLPRCINSILAQTFTEYELWLVDDGSPDRCGEICDAYAAKDARIKVIHKANGGLSDARNAALDKISGEYISFVDSDDWVAPDFLQHFIDALERNDADMAICNIVAVYDSGTIEHLYHPASSETLLVGDEVFQELLQPSAANKFYKASIFDKLRYPKGRLYEDLFIYTDILAQTKRVVLTGYNDYFYFQRNDSIMHASYSLRSTDIIVAFFHSSQKLDILSQPFYAQEVRLFVYSQAAVAFAKLDRNNPEHNKRLYEVKAIYNTCFPKLIKENRSLKQRFRLVLLRLSPCLHTFLFGNKMPQIS